MRTIRTKQTLFATTQNDQTRTGLVNARAASRFDARTRSVNLIDHRLIEVVVFLIEFQKGENTLDRLPISVKR
jgi:hypothetical protein